MLIRLLKKGENAVKAYLDLRQNTIEAKSADFKKSGEEPFRAVFAMLCDYNVSTPKEKEKYCSLACFADGTAELFNSQGGRIPRTQNSAEIKKAVLNLLNYTENSLGLFKKTVDFYLPEIDNARIYAITENGIYMVEYNMDFIWAHEESLAEIRKLSDCLKNILLKSANS